MKSVSDTHIVLSKRCERKHDLNRSSKGRAVLTSTHGAVRGVMNLTDVMPDGKKEANSRSDFQNMAMKCLFCLLFTKKEKKQKKNFTK